MHTLTLLFLLTVGLHCQNPSYYTITISCGNCGSSCLTYDGGPFNNYIFPISGTCAQKNSELQNELGPDYSYPFTYTISCGIVCSGCGISSSFTNSSSTLMITRSNCADTDRGIATLKYLNNYYQFYQNEKGVTYDWCGNVSCIFPSNLGLILGLVFGISGGLLIIIGIIAYCVKWAKIGLSRKPTQLVKKGQSSKPTQKPTTKTIQM